MATFIFTNPEFIQYCLEHNTDKQAMKGFFDIRSPQYTYL